MSDSMVRVRVQVTSAGLVVNTKKDLKRTMRQAGSLVALATRRLLRASSSGGRVYYGSGGSSRYKSGYVSGRHVASLPGAAPNSQTGTLARSIKVRPFRSGEGVAVRESAFYALFLAAGARGGGGVKGARNKRGGVAGVRDLAPRPSLTTALAQNKPRIDALIRAAVDRDIGWVRTRAT